MKRLTLTPMKVARVACVGIASGSLAPWEASLAGAHTGLDGAGKYTLLLSLVAALLLLRRRPWPAIVGALGLFCSAIGVVNILDIASSTREPAGLEPSSVEVDWGLWLTALSSMLLVVSAYRFHREIAGPRSQSRRRQSRAEQWIRANPVLFGLLVLLAVGLVLRVWLTIAWNPAFTGYSDSGTMTASVVGAMVGTIAFAISI